MEMTGVTIHWYKCSPQSHLAPLQEIFCPQYEGLVPAAAGCQCRPWPRPASAGRPPDRSRSVGQTWGLSPVPCCRCCRSQAAAGYSRSCRLRHHRRGEPARHCGQHRAGRGDVPRHDARSPPRHLRCGGGEGPHVGLVTLCREEKYVIAGLSEKMKEKDEGYHHHPPPPYYGHGGHHYRRKNFQIIKPTTKY